MSLFERYVFVCVNRRPDGAPKGSCATRGSEAVYARLKELLAERGFGRVRYRACTSSCLEACRHGPSVLVEPDHLLYRGVTQADALEIVESLESGEPIARLLLPREDAGS